MAQIINVCKVTETGELIQNTDINFAPLLNYITQSKESMDQYPWLSSVDEYGDTIINRLQSVHVIEELRATFDSIDDDTLKQIIQESMNFLKTLDTHEYIKFIGD